MAISSQASVRWLAATWKRWQLSVSLAAFVACLCLSMLRVPSVLIAYDAFSQSTFLAFFALFLVVGAFLSRRRSFCAFLVSKSARVLSFVLLSPLWIILLSKVLVLRYRAGGTAGSLYSGFWRFLCGPAQLAWALFGVTMALGFALLTASWFWSIEHGLMRRLFVTTMQNVFIAVGLLVFIAYFDATFFGVALVLCATLLACLLPKGELACAMADGAAERAREKSTLLEKFLLVGLCVVGFAYQTLGGIAQVVRSGFEVGAIYFAGALVVLIFFTIQFYFLKVQKDFRWKQILFAFSAFLGILLVVVVFSPDWDLVGQARTLIMLFGSVCFVMGVLFLVSLYARHIPGRFITTALYAQGVFFGSSSLAMYVVGLYGGFINRPTGDDVFILLVLAAAVSVGLLILLLSHKQLAEALHLALIAGSPVLSADGAGFGFAKSSVPYSLEDRCLELQQAYQLTAREGEVLVHAARGKTAATIAGILYISRDTANTHIQHIYQKLGVSSRDTLIALVDSPTQDAHQN